MKVGGMQDFITTGQAECESKPQLRRFVQFKNILSGNLCGLQDIKHLELY